MITSQNIPSEAQDKDFLFHRKNIVPFSGYSQGFVFLTIS